MSTKKLQAFYKSRQWETFIDRIRLERTGEDGLLLCEHCGKPIFGKSIEDGLDAAKKALAELTERVEALDAGINKSIKDADEATREKEAFKLILTSQVDMLYYLFMSSALPQYQKDTVGERISKMREALSENANTE